MKIFSSSCENKNYVSSTAFLLTQPAAAACWRLLKCIRQHGVRRAKCGLRPALAAEAVRRKMLQSWQYGCMLPSVWQNGKAKCFCYGAGIVNVFCRKWCCSARQSM
ncbi:hypothetical protein NPIL_660861 [Nephila pilipes]|uniref:Uncharacterized protein n=1 Tax=Nephila pilipes TaxID=299642 RepID=A0A8X6UHE7_NEPPI|nr:hypothetical protein NPIL_660861 [Nephila pilipes]